MAGNPSTTLTNKDQVLAQLTNHRGDHLLVVGGRDDPHCVCENLKEDTVYRLNFHQRNLSAAKKSQPQLIFNLQSHYHIFHLYLRLDSLITEPVCMKKTLSGNKDVFVLF